MTREAGSATVIAIGLAVALACAAGLLYSRGRQAETDEFVKRKNSSAKVARELSEVLGDTDLCTCQINQRTFDATKTTPALAFNELRTACGAGPILLQTGTPVSGGMKVKKMELAELKPSQPGSSIWNGMWRVHWEHKGGMPLLPAEIPLRLQLNPEVLAATPGAAVIQSCLKSLVSN